jgi:hypothetical protein
MGGCVSINETTAVLIDKQVRDYVLCGDCEQRFNGRGEDWVMRNCYRGEKFPVKEKIDALAPAVVLGESNWYSGATIADLRMDRLVYFGASVFWRASAHDWGFPEQISLGPYEEKLRQFLMDQADFPKNMTLIIGVITEEDLLGHVGTPTGGRTERGYFLLKFFLLGITFSLIVGKLIPKTLQDKCAHRSPEKFIRTGDRVDFLSKIHLSRYRNAELKGKLASMI